MLAWRYKTVRVKVSQQLHITNAFKNFTTGTSKRDWTIVIGIGRGNFLKTGVTLACLQMLGIDPF
jgi:hypothetical protein